ncbi:MAG: hypothetical protein ACXAES_08205 [Promethearchaeota archaeon]|jgi:hypothetical protein
MSPRTEEKYRTFKSDAAPFFFYIDVIPIDLSLYEIKHHVELLKNMQFNPIMPLPLRVDRVFNGETSILMRPPKPISFPIEDDSIAVINPPKFVEYGIEKLINFTEIRASAEFVRSLRAENAKKWWDATKYLHGRLRALEEDFTAFLIGYLSTILKAKMLSEDLISAAVKYCEIIRNICNKRIEEKYVVVETKGKEKIVNLYKMKEGKSYKKLKSVREKLLYPTFVDIEVYNFAQTGKLESKGEEINFLKEKSKIMKYIPLLFYDDLLECMLQNLETLKEDNINILDPTFLLEKNIILLIEKKDWSPEELKNYTWFDEFNQINVESILASIEPTFLE